MAFSLKRDQFIIKVLRQMYMIKSSQKTILSPAMSLNATGLMSSQSDAYHCHSCYSTSSVVSKTPKQETKKLKITSQPPSGGTSDWVGPPDATSNIRPIKFYIPPNETETEKEFRLRREETWQWNHKFWEAHNAKFFEEKDLFAKNVSGDDKNKKLSPEEMSAFYRKFLNENRQAHLQYNKEWYKRNISLLWPALKVSLINLRRKFSRNKSVAKKCDKGPV